jgi:hypothetical protein
MKNRRLRPLATQARRKAVVAVFVRRASGRKTGARVDTKEKSLKTENEIEGLDPSGLPRPGPFGKSGAGRISGLAMRQPNPGGGCQLLTQVKPKKRVMKNLSLVLENLSAKENLLLKSRKNVNSEISIIGIRLIENTNLFGAMNIDLRAWF